MKKVCHLSSVHSRFDIRVFLKECTSLAKAGFDVSFIVADGENDEIRNDVKIYGVEKRKSKLKRMVITTLTMYKKAATLDSDIYHLHDPELIPLGLKLKKMKKIVIFDSHENIEKQLLSKPYFNSFIAIIISRIYAFYERWALSKIDLIVTATSFVRDKFMNFHTNVCAINNYPILGELKCDMITPKKYNYITFIGAITEIRGIKQMVQALELCATGVRLKIAGNFFSKSLYEEVKLLKGWEKVDELGYLNRKEIQQLLSEVHAGLVLYLPVPYHVESQPNKMFEYMSAGIPVIASHYPLWKNIIEGEKCGLCVDPNDPKAIAESIDWVINHPKDANLMGINGLNCIHSKYNWNIEEKKLIDAYKNLVLKF